MRINVAIARNISEFRDTDGQLTELFLVADKGENSDLVIQAIPDNFNNDYELIFALKESFEKLFNRESFIEDAGRRKTIQLVDSIPMSKETEDILKNSDSATLAVKKTFFSINHNLVKFRFTEEHSAFTVYKEGKCVHGINWDGNFFKKMPDMFLAYNLQKLEESENLRSNFGKKSDKETAKKIATLKREIVARDILTEKGLI